MLRLERVPLEGADWETLDALPDRNVFQTRGWLEFVARSQGAEPVLARVRRDGEEVGWFSGLVVSRYGVRILGSPFQGWMTGPMGFNLAPGVARRDAMQALLRFALRQLRCLHVEVLDRRADFHELEGMGARLARFHTFEVDLDQDEDAIFTGMTSACRRAVRKSVKEGVRVEEAHGIEFADEYYEQLIDVFAKQGRRPPYGPDRVRQMIGCVEPTGRLLMLRALSPDGERIATAIFPFTGEMAYFWGGASWRSHQPLRPNEALFWYAMRTLKGRGVTLLDLGGGGEYKRKFGPRERWIPFFRKSRVPGMMAVRDLAARIYWRRAIRPPAGSKVS